LWKGNDGILHVGDTPNKVLSALRITTRKLKMEPDKLYKDKMQWIRTDFDALNSKSNPDIEDTSRINYAIKNQTYDILYSVTNSYRGLGGQTLFLDLNSDKY
jgi:hypothetical protein